MPYQLRRREIGLLGGVENAGGRVIRRVRPVERHLEEPWGGGAGGAEPVDGLETGFTPPDTRQRRGHAVPRRCLGLGLRSWRRFFQHRMEVMVCQGRGPPPGVEGGPPLGMEAEGPKGRGSKMPCLLPDPGRWVETLFADEGRAHPTVHVERWPACLIPVQRAHHRIARTNQRPIRGNTRTHATTCVHLECAARGVPSMYGVYQAGVRGNV